MPDRVPLSELARQLEVAQGELEDAEVETSLRNARHCEALNAERAAERRRDAALQAVKTRCGGGAR